jgi:hypothetical protein
MWAMIAKLRMADEFMNRSNDLILAGGWMNGI